MIMTIAFTNHLVSFFVVIEDKYINLEMGESEFKWMALVMMQLPQLQPMIMGSPSF
jgi:hypothetical protein